MMKYEWSEEALALHNLIYSTVFGELRLKNLSKDRIKLLKKALALIGKLDSLLMDIDKHSLLYTDHYLELFLILKQVNLDGLLKKQIAETWGVDCLFITLLKKGESLCV